MTTIDYREIVGKTTQLVQQDAKVRLDKTTYEKLGLDTYTDEELDFVKRYLINARGASRYHVLIDAHQVRVQVDNKVYGEDVPDPDIYLVQPKYLEDPKHNEQTQHVIDISDGYSVQFEVGDIQYVKEQYQSLYIGLAQVMLPRKQTLIGHILLVLMSIIMYFAFGVNIFIIALFYIGGINVLGNDIDQYQKGIHNQIQGAIGYEERYIANALFQSIRGWIGYQKTQELINKYSYTGAWDNVLKFKTIKGGHEE